MVGKTTYAREKLPYYGRKELVVEEHTTPEIVTEIRRAHSDYAPEYDKIAADFWHNDVEHTGKVLFNVLKKHVVYDTEHPNNQQIKSPGAIFHQKHGDCKHYASVIIGVADALRRQGKKIQGKYRFVADGPGQEIHHVFAVLSDGKHEYWVDPVLNEFNTKPVFYNQKDVDMCALYRVSGTNFQDDGRPRGLALVGKKKNNIFRQIAHGMEVNAANAGKGVKHAAHDVAQGAKNTVKKVEHIVLNVGASPARNAFLALLDLNAFNLATRMSDAWTNHRHEVETKWKDLGGDPKKLLAAINNGRKHKAFYHGQAPASHLSGTFDDVLNGRTRYVPVHIHRIHSPHYKHAYHLGHDDYGRLPAVSGIGEPVSIATLSALASAIIAAFSKWMKPDKGDHNAAEAAKDGVSNIIQSASDAIDAGQTDKGMALMQAAKAGSEAVANMQVAAGTTPDGTPAVAITDFSHPQLMNAGTPAGAAQVGPADYPDVPAANPNDSPLQTTATDLTAYARNMWESYKMPIIFTAAGFVAYKVASGSRKGKKFIAPIIGLGVAGGVVYMVVTKKKFAPQH